MKKPLDWLIKIVIVMFLSIGLWNFVLTKIGLGAWKQIITAAILVLCIFELWNKVKAEVVMVVAVAAFITTACIFSSITGNMKSFTVFFNIWFYISWIPFYIYFSVYGVNKLAGWFPRFVWLFLVISSLGLFMDMNYGTFSYLNSTEESVTYALQNNIAMRSAFWFLTSTFVMPVICGCILLSEIAMTSYRNLIISLISVPIAMLAAGSLSGFFVAVVFLFGEIALHSKNIKNTFIVSAICIAILSVYSIVSAESSRQIDRIEENFHVDSESNDGRYDHWYYAINMIDEFSPIENVLGLGIGSTNSQHNDGFLLPTHGESSFLQAYLEGGIAAVLLRVLPFIIIVLGCIRSGFSRKYKIITVYAGIIFIAVMFAPTFGSSTIQMLLGCLAGIVSFRGKIKKEF